MKRALCGVLLIIGLAAAGEDQIGTTVMPLFKVGFGPRAAALGEAYVALANDIGGVWWNPAGMDQLVTGDALVAHHEWFRDVRDEYIGALYPVSPRSTWGGGLIFSSTARIEQWDDANFPIGTFATFSGVLFGTYSYKVFKNLAVGAGAKYAYENLHTGSGQGGAVDLGVHYRPFEPLRLGVAAQNLGAMSYSQTWRSLPSAIRVGAAYTYQEYGILLADYNYTLGQVSDFHIGAEYWLSPLLSLRLGYRTGPVDLAKLGWFAGLTAGLGVRFDEFHVDLAYSHYGYLGPTLRLALGRTFGERPKTAALIVKVIDGETNQPLAANLALTGLRRKQAATDSTRGEFLAYELPRTRVAVTATRKEYIAESDSIKVVPPDTAVLTIVLSKIPPGLLVGRIYDVKTNLPLAATVAYSGYASGSAAADQASGNYATSKLHYGSYQLAVTPQNPSYFGQDAEVVIEAGKTTTRDFGLLRQKEVLTLPNVNFATGTDSLLPESYPALDAAGKILLDNPKVSVELAGHTDIRHIGSPDFPSNLVLSQRRAEAVKRYLVEKYQIDPARLIAKGYGATQPIASNLTEEGMALNRRTEFRVLAGAEYYQEFKR